MESPKVELKKTVRLPQTDFPMKANLPQNEPKTLARWESIDLYQKLRETGAGRPRYVLHDGPPYANGNIHLGHAFNKILKDFIIKSKTMAGYDSPYIPGWDCHGLPIEIKVDSLLGSKKASMTQAQIRAECRKYADKFVDLQRKDFIRLGVFGRWNDYYSTMSAEYESVIAQAFVDFLDKGYVYKGLKPVNWCMNCRTALAEAEVEYENHSSSSIWVRFALQTPPENIAPELKGRKVYGVIWTTTPWTMPANMAISFHPRYDYSAVDVNGDVYIIASELVHQTAAKLGWPVDLPVVATFRGAQMEGTVFDHPFLERDSRGILGDHVTLEAGVGAVHTAPGHGQEDYVVGQQYGIATYCPVDAGGRLFQAEGADGQLPEELLGKSVWAANPIVIDILAQREALLGQEKIEHSYPHCWRCHKPTIFRATEQWFIGMEKNDLRQRTLDAIKKVSWHPEWGEERISNMIATRPDWCISRQRVWGVPIVAFHCETCETTVTEKAILDRVIEKFKVHTADAWYSMTVEELVDGPLTCAKCGSHSFKKETDILDVWFDSGASHLAVLNEKNDLQWPSDMYLEGGDQYRGWFHSSLLIGMGLKGESPYREIVTSGWTLDEQGRAMSKSLGNTVEPEAVIKEYGAEVLRLWVSSVAYYEDVRLGQSILKQLSDAYRKFRNTFRYALGATGDFDPAVNSVTGEQMFEVDQWILYRLDTIVDQCCGYYKEYAFNKVYRALYDFATVDLSSVYFDMIKDRLYTWPGNDVGRRSAQTAVWRINYALTRLLAPVLAFTAEEVWSYMHKPAGAPDSVHMDLFPAKGELVAGLPSGFADKAAKWDRLLALRGDVMKSLEEARQAKLIGSGLEAAITITAGSDVEPLLREYLTELPAFFVVSKVTLEKGEDFRVAVEKSTDVKCERCWKYMADVGINAQFPTICGRCAEAVAELL
ncbi:isoleucine--tRNA ligase [Bryobacterales bacterium F-183]|nr:isoleucine--tRNA ligase [Bryobacterales bacterium F-183]